MTELAQSVFQALDRDRENVLQFMRELIGRQPHGEAAVQDAVASALAEAGGVIERIVYDPARVPVVNEFASGESATSSERESVVATFGGRGAGRSMILFAHPDAEPMVADPDWRHDPFAGVDEGGRFYGWGVADDLSGVAACVSAMAAIRPAGITLAGDVIVASTPSKRHARGVAAVLHHGYSADAAIYLHPAESGVGMREIKAFASGQLEFSITVTGKPPETTEPVQTAFAHRAINPLDKAMVLIDALKALDAERGERVHHPLLDAAIGRSTNILISSLQLGGNHALYRVPVECTFSGVVAFPPAESLAMVQREIEAAFSRAVAADDWMRQNPPVLEWLSGISGTDVPQDHPLYRIAAESISATSAFAPHVNPLHTASDIRNPWVQKGIPAVGFGPLCGDLTQTGGRDEWVDTEDYLRFVKAAAASIIGWCGVHEGADHT